ncbi:MAG: (2Fe-2S)-binding protein [Dehalococcoidia bacterium]|jgi:NADH dehydrogenase/NADH:ubiquinone oxidoreductase subunit G|nr:(2Fe-2S)-binding protein [Chloroflexota bacterium]MCK4242952.1 (2Fe-2S)-binding protein [Dehalococcoidia bacterium]
MREVTLEIDGREIKAKEGMTILEAAGDAGIYIPTLCYHEKLAPYGACRLCTVEISRNKRTRLVTACVYPVEDGLVVKTASPKVIKVRKMLLELMLASAPVKVIEDLALRYGVGKTRFEAERTMCILCGLCVRYCNEIKKANAIGFVGRGIERKVVFFPEIASTICASCRECFGLCPTGKIPSETDGVCFDDLTVDDFLSTRIP